MATTKKDETVEENKSEVAEAVTEEKTEEKAKSPKKEKKPAKEKVAAPSGEAPTAKSSKRAEKIGTVFSDKMTKTVVVRVDRTVKHPLYHKYMKRRKKFMAHDELGAAMGDRVKIVETRPLSARKRWRVVEIIQKADK